MIEAPGPDIALVMPAYNAARHLDRSLGRVMAQEGLAEVLVVDPGSDDGTPELAERLGARVLRLGHRAGPAEARNAGVAQVRSPVVLFVDSDCVVADDVVERVRAAFRDETLATLTGSYCDEPPERNFFSLYMNLRHHHTHQIARRENATFWAGCGAVRRSFFEAVGGFDAERFPRPMVEDIELGLRLRELGATRLDPELQVTHLKHWSMLDVIRTDVLCRALPWSKLIVEGEGPPDDLNLRLSQRLAAALAPLVLLALLALSPIAVVDARWLVLPFLVIALSVVLNGGLLAFFLQRRGPLFALGAFVFHQIHLLYSAATYALVALFYRPKRKESLA